MEYQNPGKSAVRLDAWLLRRRSRRRVVLAVAVVVVVVVVVVVEQVERLKIMASGFVARPLHKRTRSFIPGLRIGDLRARTSATSPYIRWPRAHRAASFLPLGRARLAPFSSFRSNLPRSAGEFVACTIRPFRMSMVAVDKICEKNKDL